MSARVEGMMHIGETEEWENWRLFYIDYVTLYRIKFKQVKKKFCSISMGYEGVYFSWKCGANWRSW